MLPTRVLSVLLTALSPVGLLAAETIPAKPVDGKIAWVYSYSEGQAAARESGKPLFVVFRCER